MDELISIRTKDEASFQRLIKDAVKSALAEVSTAKPDKYLTRKEVAEQLRVSLVSIDKAVADGRLHSHRLGGRILFRESDIKLDNPKFKGKK